MEWLPTTVLNLNFVVLLWKKTSAQDRLKKYNFSSPAEILGKLIETLSMSCATAQPPLGGLDLTAIVSIKFYISAAGEENKLQRCHLTQLSNSFTFISVTILLVVSNGKI